GQAQGNGPCRTPGCRDPLQLGSCRPRHARVYLPGDQTPDSMTARTKDKSRSAQIAAPASTKPDRKDRAPTLAHRDEYYAMRATIGALRALSWEAASRVGARLGALGYRPLGIRKRVVERQIAAAFPDLDH